MNYWFTLNVWIDLLMKCILGLVMLHHSTTPTLKRILVISEIIDKVSFSCSRCWSIFSHSWYKELHNWSERYWLPFQWNEDKFRIDHELSFSFQFEIFLHQQVIRTQANKFIHFLWLSFLLILDTFVVSYSYRLCLRFVGGPSEWRLEHIDYGHIVLTRQNYHYAYSLCLDTQYLHR